MSVQPETAEQQFQCAHCGEPRDPHASVGGSFCTEECRIAHKGRSALNQIESDHRYCASCFRQVKTTHRPTDEELREMDVRWSIREAFIGYQWRTEHGVPAEVELPDMEPADADIQIENPPVRGATGCVCGAIDHRDHDADLARIEGLASVGQHLLVCLRELAEREALDADPCPREFLDALEERPGDWEHAAGRALYA